MITPQGVYLISYQLLNTEEMWNSNDVKWFHVKLTKNIYPRNCENFPFHCIRKEGREQTRVYLGHLFKSEFLRNKK